jgi:hypothetical protein
MRTSAVVIVLLLGACARPPIDSVTPNDAYGDSYVGDMGVQIVYPDMGVDGGSMDAPDMNVDAPGTDAPGNDAGILPPAIVLDGQFDEAIWTANPSNPMLSNSEVATSPFDGDALMSLYYARDADWLYLGLEGALASPSDAIVIYLDTATSPPGGVFLTQSGLMDHGTTVRSVLSNGITGTLDFQPEWGWGTSAMPIAATSGEQHVGWLLLASTGSFTQISSGTRSFCTATACETYVGLRDLGIDVTLATPTPIHLIVRMGRPDPVGWANPAFPTADNGNPQAVGSVTITIAPPP